MLTMIMAVGENTEKLYSSSMCVNFELTYMSFHFNKSHQNVAMRIKKHQASSDESKKYMNHIL